MTYTKERATEMYDKVQQCPNCDGYHSGYNPPLCYGCATGMAQSGKSKGHHPNA